MPEHTLRWLCLVLLLAVSACQPAPRPIPTETPNAATVRAMVTALSTPLATLPATWTPTHTHTPAPTRTPIPTQTPIPTLSAARICARFQLSAAPPENALFTATGTLQFAWRFVAPTAGVLIVIVPENGGDKIQAEVPFEGDGAISLPANRLPGPGRYRWALAVIHPAYGALCERQGTFRLLAERESPASPTPAATATDTVF